MFDNVTKRTYKFINILSIYLINSYLLIYRLNSSACFVLRMRIDYLATGNSIQLLIFYIHFQLIPFNLSTLYIHYNRYFTIGQVDSLWYRAIWVSVFWLTIYLIMAALLFFSFLVWHSTCINSIYYHLF